MSKPTTPPSTTDEGYFIDMVSDSRNTPPNMVQTHLRHLLVACELGDLVLLEAERTTDGKQAYLICASVVSADDKRRLLPICELENTSDLLSRYRPPAVAENGFVKPTHSGNYTVCMLANPNEIALAEVASDENNVH